MQTELVSDLQVERASGLFLPPCCPLACTREIRTNSRDGSAQAPKASREGWSSLDQDKYPRTKLVEERGAAELTSSLFQQLLSKRENGVYAQGQALHPVKHATAPSRSRRP